MPDELERRRIPYFGDFVLFDEIGRGGMGVVYDAHQSSLDRPVALKVLHSNFAANEAAAQRLRIEAEAASFRSESTRLNSSHQIISYAVFCLKKKNNKNRETAIQSHQPTRTPTPHNQLGPNTTGRPARYVPTKTLQTSAHD